MTDVCVCTKDPIFGRFLVLTLSPALRRVTLWTGSGKLPAADAYVVDADTLPPPETDAPILCCGWGRDLPPDERMGWLERPFRPARLLAVLGLGHDEDAPPPAPLAGRDAVRSGGRVIALTPRESAVYRLLYEAGGAAVSREEIHRRVWGGEGDPSVVNVYIHYLRRKLSDGARQPIRHVRGGYALCLGTHAPPDEAGE